METKDYLHMLVHQIHTVVVATIVALVLHNIIPKDKDSLAD